MNLIQIQDELKGLPTQVIMSYANGQNPEVPPYMALGELNRRKTSEQRKTEKPTQSVKEKLEAEVGGQGMPQGMPQAPQGIAQLPAAQMPQGAPQAMPPGAPQGMPPGMAAGGLAELPVRDDMFHYAPGGIVAFGGGGEADEETAGLQSLVGPATDILRKAMIGDSNIPMPQDPEAAKQEAIKRDPRLAAILNKIPGEEYLALVDKLKAQNEASKAEFQKNQGRLGLGALGDALIAAGESTRGQKGIGAAFAGFGKSYSASTAEQIKRQQAQQALERQQEIEVAKLQSDSDNLRMAYATGDIDKIAKYKQAVAERQAKIEGNKVAAAKEGISLGMEETKMKGTLAHYEATEKNQSLTLQEMISNHADQAFIESQKIAVQEAQNKRTAAHQTVMEDLARSTRPTKEEKINQLTQAKVNADPRIKGLSDRLKTAEIGSDDYYTTLDEIQKFALTHYPAGTKLPEIPRIKKPEVKEEPDFFSKLFGGSPAPKTVSFDQLPK